MDTVLKPDGVIFIALTNGLPPDDNSGLSLNTTTTWYMTMWTNGVSIAEWIRSPLQSRYLTKEAAEVFDTASEFLEYMHLHRSGQ